MRPNRLLALAGLAVLAVAALAHNLPRPSPGLLNWAEPGNVAAALAGGRGFSDPFDGGTGPTAWVSPLPVLVDAAVFAAFGTKTAAAARALLILAVLGLAGANALLASALRPHGPWVLGLSCAAFLAYACLLPGGPLEVQSEAWVDILLSALLLWSVLGIASGRRLAPHALVLCGLLAPLENAGLAAAVGLCAAALLALGRRTPGRAAAPLGALAAAALAAAAWGARNQAALGGFVPLKSNFWFELNLANVDAPDGLPRMENVLRRLPFFDAGQFSLYASLGEMRYVSSFRRPALAALRRDPAHFAGNVLRRAGDAFVFNRRDGGGERTDFRFSPGDFARLVTSGELINLGGGENLWARIDTPPAAEAAKFRALGLGDGAGVLRDWSQRRLAYDAEYFGARGLLLGCLVAGVPVAALLAAALAAGGSPGAPACWAALILFSMVLPYVLVNHNERHQLPLIAMQAVMIGALAQATAARRAAARP